MSIYRSREYLTDIKTKLQNGDEVVIVFFSEIMWMWKCNICGMNNEDRTKVHVHAMNHLR